MQPSNALLLLCAIALILSSSVDEHVVFAQTECAPAGSQRSPLVETVTAATLPASKALHFIRCRLELTFSDAAGALNLDGGSLILEECSVTTHLSIPRVAGFNVTVRGENWAFVDGMAVAASSSDISVTFLGSGVITMMTQGNFLPFASASGTVTIDSSKTSTVSLVDGTGGAAGGSSSWGGFPIVGTNSGFRLNVHLVNWLVQLGGRTSSFLYLATFASGSVRLDGCTINLAASRTNVLLSGTDSYRGRLTVSVADTKVTMVGTHEQQFLEFPDKTSVMTAQVLLERSTVTMTSTAIAYVCVFCFRGHSDDSAFQARDVTMDLTTVLTADKTDDPPMAMLGLFQYSGTRVDKRRHSNIVIDADNLRFNATGAKNTGIGFFRDQVQAMGGAMMIRNSEIVSRSIDGHSTVFGAAPDTATGATTVGESSGLVFNLTNSSLTCHCDLSAQLIGPYGLARSTIYVSNCTVDHRGRSATVFGSGGLNGELDITVRDTRARIVSAKALLAVSTGVLCDMCSATVTSSHFDIDATTLVGFLSTQGIASNFFSGAFHSTLRMTYAGLIQREDSKKIPNVLGLSCAQEAQRNVSIAWDNVTATIETRDSVSVAAVSTLNRDVKTLSDVTLSIARSTIDWTATNTSDTIALLVVREHLTNATMSVDGLVYRLRVRDRGPDDTVFMSVAGGSKNMTVSLSNSDVTVDFQDLIESGRMQMLSGNDMDNTAFYVKECVFNVDRRVRGLDPETSDEEAFLKKLTSFSSFGGTLNNLTVQWREVRANVNSIGLVFVVFVEPGIELLTGPLKQATNLDWSLVGCDVTISGVAVSTMYAGLTNARISIDRSTISTDAGQNFFNINTLFFGIGAIEGLVLRVTHSVVLHNATGRSTRAEVIGIAPVPAWLANRGQSVSNLVVTVTNVTVVSLGSGGQATTAGALEFADVGSDAFMTVSGLTVYARVTTTVPSVLAVIVVTAGRPRALAVVDCTAVINGSIVKSASVVSVPTSPETGLRVSGLRVEAFEVAGPFAVASVVPSSTRSLDRSIVSVSGLRVRGGVFGFPNEVRIASISTTIPFARELSVVDTSVEIQLKGIPGGVFHTAVAAGERTVYRNVSVNVLTQPSFDAGTTNFKVLDWAPNDAVESNSSWTDCSVTISSPTAFRCATIGTYAVAAARASSLYVSGNSFTNCSVVGTGDASSGSGSTQQFPALRVGCNRWNGKRLDASDAFSATDMDNLVDECPITPSTSFTLSRSLEKTVTPLPTCTFDTLHVEVDPDRGGLVEKTTSASGISMVQISGRKLSQMTRDDTIVLRLWTEQQESGTGFKGDFTSAQHTTAVVDEAAASDGSTPAATVAVAPGGLLAQWDASASFSFARVESDSEPSHPRASEVTLRIRRPLRWSPPSQAEFMRVTFNSSAVDCIPMNDSPMSFVVAYQPASRTTTMSRVVTRTLSREVADVVVIATFQPQRRGPNALAEAGPATWAEASPTTPHFALENLRDSSGTSRRFRVKLELRTGRDVVFATDDNDPTKLASDCTVSSSLRDDAVLRPWTDTGGVIPLTIVEVEGNGTALVAELGRANGLADAAVTADMRGSFTVSQGCAPSVAPHSGGGRSEFVVLHPPPPVERVVSTAADATGTAAAVASSAAGSPTAGLAVARVNFVAGVTGCEPTLGQPLPFSSSPTGLALSSEPVGYALGAAVGNTLLVLGFSTLAMFVAAIKRYRAGWSTMTVRDMLVYARLPSLALFPALFILQPAFANGLMAFVHGSNVGVRLMGLCVPLAITATFAALLRHMFFLPSGFGAKFVPVTEAEEAAAMLSEADATNNPVSLVKRLASRFLSSIGDWDDKRPGSGFVRAHFLFLADFNGTVPWWLFVDVGVSLLLALAEAFQSAGSRSSCTALGWVGAILLLALLAAMLYLRPHESLFNLVFSSIIVGGQCLAAFLSLANQYTDDDGVDGFVETLLNILLFLLVVRAVYDVLRVVWATTRRRIMAVAKRREAEKQSLLLASKDDVVAATMAPLLMMDDAAAPPAMTDVPGVHTSYEAGHASMERSGAVDVDPSKERGAVLVLPESNDSGDRRGMSAENGGSPQPRQSASERRAAAKEARLERRKAKEQLQKEQDAVRLQVLRDRAAERAQRQRDREKLQEQDAARTRRALAAIRVSAVRAQEQAQELDAFAERMRHATAQLDATGDGLTTRGASSDAPSPHSSLARPRRVLSIDPHEL